MRLLPFACLIGLSAFASFARANELYVDRESRGGTCSDSRARAEVSETTPWCTLGKAANSVQAGDTVNVRGGVYTEQHNCAGCLGGGILEPHIPGTSNSWIRFVADPDETVTLRGGSGPTGAIIFHEDNLYNEVNGFVIEDFLYNGVYVWGASDVLVKNLDISDCRNLGILVNESAQRITIEGNAVHDNAMNGYGSAITLHNCGANMVVRGNYVWNNSDTHPAQTEGHGVIMDSCGLYGGTALIENNVIWANDGVCISILKSDNANVRNNTCWKNVRRHNGLPEIWLLGNNIQFFNNIVVVGSDEYAVSFVYTNGSYAVNSSTITADNNLVSGASVMMYWGGNVGTLTQFKSGNPQGWGVNDSEANPMFVDEAGFDFHVQEESPAVDSGNNAHAAVLDADGNGRPENSTVDRGAYEFGGTMPSTMPDVSSAAGGGCAISESRDHNSFLIWFAFSAIALVLGRSFKAPWRVRREVGNRY